MKRILKIVHQFRQQRKLKKICKACSINPLFPSVKDYALHITDDLPQERATGKTTAVYLRILLDAGEQTSAKTILYQLKHDPDLAHCNNLRLVRGTVCRLRCMYQKCIDSGVKLPRIEFADNMIKGPIDSGFVRIFNIIPIFERR